MADGLEMDFERDLTGFFRRELRTLGFSIGSTVPTEGVCHQYFNVMRRRIVQQPRTVLVSREFQEMRHAAGVQLVRSKAEKGDDLTPHQSGWISDPVKRDALYNDGLLNDWDVHHFHLGTTLKKPGVMVRTGPLLFARVTDSEFYMIDVLPHGSWSRQRIVELIHGNWPDSISRYRIPDTIRPATLSTDSERAQLRSSGISTFSAAADGTIYGSIGGGFTSVGTNAQIVRKCLWLKRWVRGAEGAVRSYLSSPVAARRRSFRLRLVLEDGEAFAIGRNVRLPLGRVFR
jgi:hypothetical protein